MKDGRYPDGYWGWTNRETWAVHLWLSDDPNLWEEAREQISWGGDPQFSPEEALRDFISDLVTNYPPVEGLALDLLQGALAWVDWAKLVEVLAEEVKVTEGEV